MGMRRWDFNFEGGCISVVVGLFAVVAA
jgi:hypothetical protein